MMDLDNLILFAERFSRLPPSRRRDFTVLVTRKFPEDLTLPDVCYLKQQLGYLNDELDYIFQEWFYWFEKLKTEDEEEFNLDG